LAISRDKNLRNWGDFTASYSLIKDQVEVKQSAFDLLKNKPFWVWNKDLSVTHTQNQRGDCCFNHIIGLPEKDNQEMPLFDYQKRFIDAIFIDEADNPENFLHKRKHVVLKKFTGWGASEMVLRLMLWLATSSDYYRFSQFAIVVGPREKMAHKLIKRMRRMMFKKLGLLLGGNLEGFELNNVEISAYPSNNIDSYRLLDRPKFIFLDEADFFRITLEDDLIDVTERYFGKSDPYVVMVSTPNDIDGLFWHMEKMSHPEDRVYKWIEQYHEVGLGKIMSQTDLERAKKSRSFAREYCGVYAGVSGDVFDEASIIQCENLGRLNPLINLRTDTVKSMGLDKGAGVSKLGITVVEFLPTLEGGFLRVLFSDEYERKSTNQMLAIVDNVYHTYRPRKIFVDYSNPDFIRDIKIQRGERPAFEPLLERAKKMKREPESYMQVVPIAFNKYGPSMLERAKMWVESGFMAIHPEHFPRLCSQLRTAKLKNTEDWRLEKGTAEVGHQTYDSIDSFRLALKYFRIDRPQELGKGMPRYLQGGGEL
jgi:hypothetical protein